MPCPKHPRCVNLCIGGHGMPCPYKLMLSSVLCHLSSVICHLYSVICTLYSVLCHLYSVICTLSSVLCHLYSVLCTLYSVLSNIIYPIHHTIDNHICKGACSQLFHDVLSVCDNGSDTDVQFVCHLLVYATLT